jgi:hypothetical protein
MGLAEQAEHLAEMAEEAETKKEANHYWSLYRETMIAMTGDKNLFRKKPTPTSKPSKALIRTLTKCSCGNSGWGWKRKYKKYVMECGHDGGYSGYFKDGLLVQKCNQCGVESSPQNVGEIVMFYCKCGKKTDWHFSNSEARDEWNNIQAIKNQPSGEGRGKMKYKCLECGHEFYSVCAPVCPVCESEFCQTIRKRRPNADK